MSSIVLIEYAFLLLPLGCFLASAVTEIRFHTKEDPLFILRMAEITAGVIALVAIMRVGQSVVLSWTMVSASLLLGGFSLVSKYASRIALRCVLIGNALLCFLWYFKGAYHH